MIAIDTNVLVYSLDRHELVKRAKARALLRQLRATPSGAIPPWQVVGELASYLRPWQHRRRITRAAAMRYLALHRGQFSTVMPIPSVLDRALDLSGRFSRSHWDSMLLDACLEAGVDTLYTEDMGAPTPFDGLRLINLFI